MDHQFPPAFPESAPLKTAAFYGRYSTALTHCSSLAVQLGRCEEYAKTSGLVISPIHTYTDDSDQGKPILPRAGFRALQQAVQSSPKPFDYVLIEDKARCSRDFAVVKKFTDLLRKHDIEVRFLNQQLDSKDAHFNLILELEMTFLEGLIAHRRKQRAQASRKQ